MRKLIKKILREDEFDFINDSPELHGVTFKVVGYDQIYQINDIGSRSYVDVTWVREGLKRETAYKRDTVNKYFRDGSWVVYDGPYSESINESDDLDWISDAGDNLNKIKLGATFRPTYQYDPTLLIKIHKVEFDEEDPMYSRVGVRGLESDGNTFDTIYYLETFLEWLDNGDLELVPDDFGDFGFPEELLNHPPLSESSELDWIKDIEPPSYDSLVGKALYFDPHISRPEQLKSVLKPLKMLGFHYDVWADDFIGEEDGEEIIGLYLRPDDGGITYTAWIDEDYEYHISEWAGEPVQVLDGWQILQPFI